MSFWVTGITAAVGIAGATTSAVGTQNAVNAQNNQAIRNAANQDANSFYNVLRTQGINIQQLIANDPRGSDFWSKQYAEQQAKGNRDSFDTWFFKAINNSRNDPIWSAIANPAANGAAANTTAPSWAVDASGKPIQPALYNQLIGISNSKGEGAAVAQKKAIVDQWMAAHPDLKANWDADPEGWASVYGSLENYVLADYDGNATPDQKKTIGDAAAQGSGTAAGGAGTGNNTTLDPRLAALIGQSTDTAGKIFDDTYLKQTQGALAPIAKARDDAAAAAVARITEQRGLSGALKDTELAGIKDVLAARTAGAGGIYDASIANATGVRDAGTSAANDIYNTNVAKLADVLGVRLDAAKQIYDATMTSAGGVRDARNAGAAGIYGATKTGAQDIYGAELGRADTYAQSAQDALTRILAQNTADRARQGFTGGSSGSDITRARLMADYTQRGAGARADANVNLQGRLSDAGIGYQTRLSDSGVGYATDTGRAGIGLATTSGQSREQDAIAQLNAAVERAKSLGLINTNFAGQTGQAGVTRASTLANAGEQNAIANLQAQADDARRRLTYLTSDGDIAKANADLQNAQDQLNAITQNQNLQTGSITLPYQLAGLDLSTKANLSNQQYADWDALMKRLGAAAPTGNTPGPTLTTPNTTAPINDTQILGQFLTSLSSMGTSSGGSSALSTLLKGFTGGGATTPTTTPSTSTGSLTSTPSFLGGASVFKNPYG